MLFDDRWTKNAKDWIYFESHATMLDMTGGEIYNTA